MVTVLEDLLANRGSSCFLRIVNGPEFIADVLADWAAEIGVVLLFIEPGSPWMNGKVESFNGRLRGELLNGQLFDNITEAQILLDHWRQEYNNHRPHSSLGYLFPRAFISLSVHDQSRIRTRSSKSLSGKENVVNKRPRYC